MSLTVIVVILVVLMAAVGALVVLMTMGSSVRPDKMKQQAAVSTNLRSLVAAQRKQQESPKSASQRHKDNLALAAAAESEFTRKRTAGGSRMTLEKKLRYARWSITPIQYRAIQSLTTVALVIPVYLNFSKMIVFLVAIMVPLMFGSMLDAAVARRFKAFDLDYPVLLLSFVSLLKTGMSSIGGLEAAAKGLDEGSLVRIEVELLIERLRLGLTEEQAINAFGEDVAHPELELFVQSLLLSRRVGGTLSTTLERLAKQVRKRQQFRQQAVAAVGMERGSIWMIAGIMSCLLGYLAISSPELIFPAFANPTGSSIFQGGICAIVFGFYWSRKVTNIKV